MRSLATPTRCPASTNRFRHLAISLHQARLIRLRQPLSQGPAAPSRFFLDVFAGVNAPLSQAAAKASLDRYEPLDIVSNAEHDILLDATFESLLRLCWSGTIGLIVCAPPCKESSRLKMRPGGPQPSGHPPTWMVFPASALLSYRKCETAVKSIAEAEPSYMQSCAKKGWGSWNNLQAA